jgi:hypothetical protein
VVVAAGWTTVAVAVGETAVELDSPTLQAAKNKANNARKSSCGYNPLCFILTPFANYTVRQKHYTMQNRRHFPLDKHRTPALFRFYPGGVKSPGQQLLRRCIRARTRPEPELAAYFHLTRQTESYLVVCKNTDHPLAKVEEDRQRPYENSRLAAKKAVR